MIYNPECQELKDFGQCDNCPIRCSCSAQYVSQRYAQQAECEAKMDAIIDSMCDDIFYNQTKLFDSDFFEED